MRWNRASVCSAALGVALIWRLWSASPVDAKTGSGISPRSEPHESAALLSSPGSFVIWHQGGFVTTNSEDISTQVVANDFVISAPVVLQRMDAWLTDDVVNDNGILDDFSGVLGWAIFADAGGHPGELLASGQDAATVVTDTGVQDNFGADIAKVEARLIPPVALVSGRYWLALHENNWGSPYDGTTIWWERTSPSIGFPPRGDTNLSSPSLWNATLDGSDDLAFVLYAQRPTAAPVLSLWGYVLVVLGLTAIPVLSMGAEHAAVTDGRLERDRLD